MDLNEKLQILSYIYPNGGYTIRNGEIFWLNKNIKEPTEKELLKISKSSNYKNRLDIKLNELQIIKTKSELAEIDLKSIRSLREWLSSQPDAPKFIKDYEKEAKEKRKKLK